MKIESLTLHGFKSFADRTEVDFHDGITAIVGPNGCGKSNISDALRWVLGEQRPSAIRGSRMEEAIFSGTAERRPISRAEVSLTLSNEDGLLPVPYAEVVMGRTVYRGGESDYRLNGEDCRLRDIQDLCRDTGLGAIDYAVIESGMIDVILSDRADERRALFEEAAEIGRYKDRRRTALRRLQQSERDLKRLEDVLGEVRTKVRSLAQQRGRAERYRDYRSRRLRLEVAVSRARLGAIGDRIAEADRKLAKLRQSDPGEKGELAAREAAAETLRVEIAEADRERADRSRRMEEIRGRLEAAERERIVSTERAGAAERRIAAIGEELDTLGRRRDRLDEKAARAAAATESEEASVAELREKEEALQSEVEGLGAERARRTAAEEEAEARVAAADRELRRGEGDQEAADERIEERSEELGRRVAALATARENAVDQERRLVEARRTAEAAAARKDEKEGGLAAAREASRERREKVRELRSRIATLEGDLSGDRARADSLDGLLGSGEDLGPAARRILAEDGSIPGVRGVLADFLRAPARYAGAVEAHLGAYLHGIVVDDGTALDEIRRLLREEDLEAGLLLLPLDPGPRPDPAAAGGDALDDDAVPLLERVTLEGAGTPWARALLAGVDLAEGGALPVAGRPWTRADGSGRDRWGAVRIGRPAAARDSLRRRAELAELRDRIAGREAELEELRADRDRAEEARREAERRTEAQEKAFAEVLYAAREAEAREEAARERKSRVETEREELEERVEELERSLEESRERLQEGRDRLVILREEQRKAAAELESVRSRSAGLEERWESRRSELHDLQLRLARKEASLSAVRERRSRLEGALREVKERRVRLREERERERSALAEARQGRSRSEEELGELFESKEKRSEALRDIGERLDEKKEELERRESWLRRARRDEREHVERRHGLELELAELRGQRSTIRERLEGEWERPLKGLLEEVDPPEEGTPAEWAEELEEVRRRLSHLGPVNLMAEQEYGDEKERLDFLEAQKEDLTGARDDLHASIRRINRAAAEAFRGTFEEIRENFERTFATLFEGGECDLWLADPDDPLDSAIEISASPRGKRTQRIHLLSGGERALTALSLLFAIYLAKPSPFCIMDEVDAPLDESNVLRFVRMLEGFKADTQFIVITHNPRTIEAADWIYGITMQEPGVSSVVGVEFGDMPAGEVA